MPLRKPIVLRAGLFGEMESTEQTSQELLLSQRAVDPRGAIVRSFCDLNANAAALQSGTAYWVFMGQAEADLLVKAVSVYTQAASVGTDSTQIGFATGTVQPSAGVASYSLTVRAVSTINMGSTGRKVSSFAAVAVARDVYVWAFLKHSVSGILIVSPASVLPLMGAYNGELASTTSAGAPTVGVAMTATPSPYSTAQAPDLTLACELNP